MFETEVWFAANLLNRKSARGPGLVVYDELFHSTNPPDGIRTAEIFLKRLWQKSNIVSIVSTHVFSLIDGSPDSVQKLCCNATEKDGKVFFNYKVNNGVCMVSSVKNIWERFGLNAETAVKAPVENLPTEEK
jgi:DNA mismatch repair ATPase MutS